MSTRVRLFSSPLAPAGAEYSSVQVMEVMRSLALPSRTPDGMMGDRVAALGLPDGHDHLLLPGAATPNRSGQGNRNPGVTAPADGAAAAGGQARIHTN